MKLFEDLDLRIEMLDEITLVLENLEIDKDYFTDKMIEIL